MRRLFGALVLREGIVSLEFTCRVARTPPECAAYFALRQQTFCVEQGLFTGDDRDEWDPVATPIICVAAPLGSDAGAPAVVGVVRIWEEVPGDWWGGRLAVDPRFRTAAVVGRRLVQYAVGTARAWGAVRFRATVQQANVAFFRRLRWQSLEELTVLGRPHHLMQADLDRAVPTAEPNAARAARLPGRHAAA